MDKIKQLTVPIGLLFVLYFEVIFFHFPLFFLCSVVALVLFYRTFYAIYILLLSLILDSLMVNILGVTALFIFLSVIFFATFVRVSDFRTRLIMFVTLFFGSIIYGYVVGYAFHFLMYLLLGVAYLGCEMYLKKLRYKGGQAWG